MTNNDQVILDMLKTLGNIVGRIKDLETQTELIQQILETHTEILEDVANVRRPRL